MKKSLISFLFIISCTISLITLLLGISGLEYNITLSEDFLNEIVNLKIGTNIKSDEIFTYENQANEYYLDFRVRESLLHVDFSNAKLFKNLIYIADEQPKYDNFFKRLLFMPDSYSRHIFIRSGDKIISISESSPSSKRQFENILKEKLFNEY